ncbi:MAG: hypothetical protein ACE5IW_03645 [bacterium]
MFNQTTNVQQSSNEIVTQYDNWIRRNALESATNVAISKLYQNYGWQAGFTNLSFMGADYSVSITEITGDSTTEAKKIQVTSVATYENESDTSITVLMQPAYSYYYFFLNNLWPATLDYETGDTLVGPIHANPRIRIKGDPVFIAKVSSADINYHAVLGGDDPKFYGGAEFGTAIIDLSSSILTPLRNVCTSGGDAYVSEIWVEFTGTTYTVYGDPYITPLGPSQDLTDFNGTIYSPQRVHVKGTVDGQITVFSDDRLWIEDDIVCANDPSIDPTSDDFIGLIAEHQIFIADNLANRSDLIIHAAIMARHDEILVDNPGTGSRGILTIVGSIIEQDYDSTPATDYVLNHIPDSRLIDKTPPYFPRITNRVEQIYRSD